MLYDCCEAVAEDVMVAAEDYAPHFVGGASAAVLRRDRMVCTVAESRFPVSWFAWGIGNSVSYGGLGNDIRLPGGDAVDDTDHAPGYYHRHHGADMSCAAFGMCCSEKGRFKALPHGVDTHSGGFHGGAVS